METKIILGLEEQAAETAKLKSFNRGHALFLTKNHRIHAKFEPTARKKRCLIQRLWSNYFSF
ncbi:hypothetical protein [Nitrosopumilus sp.]|uniref:hypothetical protein n=1 Tax=Nitrosopumilus sp. TaxID=2024843 RepID=UPI00292DF20F|nr:hypothetical protein [Nitrosopumilus sp.]